MWFRKQLCTHPRMHARGYNTTMSQTISRSPLAGPLRARINKLAHFRALEHETLLKACLLEKVQKARDGGASFDELNALVAQLEAAMPQSCPASPPAASV
jgi:hypothetical protein